jgi:hypothetical protein
LDGRMSVLKFDGCAPFPFSWNGAGSLYAKELTTQQRTTQVPAGGLLPATKVRVVARNHRPSLPNYKCSHCEALAAFFDEGYECVWTDCLSKHVIL